VLESRVIKRPNVKTYSGRASDLQYETGTVPASSEVISLDIILHMLFSHPIFGQRELVLDLVAIDRAKYVTKGKNSGNAYRREAQL